jgi:hypothetical protein
VKLAALLVAVAGCTRIPGTVCLGEDCPVRRDGYTSVTLSWTRHATLRGEYQEVLGLDAIFISPEWRISHADRDAHIRGLEGEAREARIAQARADAKGPTEVELLVTTWDRRENDLSRGKRSVWRVVLVDDAGHEIEPVEIVRDKRPDFVVRAEFPTFNEFATAYVARFPPTPPVLGPNVHRVRLRMSSERGGVEVGWEAGP